MRQARRSQKNAIGNSARNRIQVKATLTSKTMRASRVPASVKIQPVTVHKEEPRR